MSGRRLRILQVYKTYPPIIGGIEGHLQLLATRLAARGHDVTVLTTSRGPTSESWEDGVRVVRARSLLTLRSTPLSPAQWRTQRRLANDVVHLHVPYPPGEVAELGRPRRPLVVSYHTDVVRQRLLGALLAPLRRRVIKRASRVLLTSPRYAAGSPLVRLAGDRCTVVPLGIDTGFWRPAGAAEVAEVRRRFGDQPLLLFLGRLRAYKGLAVLAEAMTRLSRGRLLVVGDGPERRALERRTEERGLTGRVDLLGELPSEEVRALATAAAVGVLPSTSRAEAFGLALLEMMACSTPVVSTELGTGTSWVNEDGVTGRVVAAADPEALARGLAELIEDPEKARRFGSAARQRAIERFGAEPMVDRVEAVYHDAISRWRAIP